MLVLLQRQNGEVPRVFGTFKNPFCAGLEPEDTTTADRPHRKTTAAHDTDKDLKKLRTRFRAGDRTRNTGLAVTLGVLLAATGEV